jgi:hypothetical protein
MDVLCFRGDEDGFELEDNRYASDVCDSWLMASRNASDCRAGRSEEVAAEFGKSGSASVVLSLLIDSVQSSFAITLTGDEG